VRIGRERKPGVVVVRVTGEVDMTAAAAFGEAISEADGVPVVVDLTGVSWLGGAAGAELVWAHQSSKGRLRVMLPPRSVVEDRAALERVVTVEPAEDVRLPAQLPRVPAPQPTASVA
jgi:hypothetical protein